MSTGVPDPLRHAVLRRLDQVDLAAGSIDPHTVLLVARRELNRLADGWRTLLTRHQSDEDGRCTVCRGLLRRRRWPCQVWRAAHEALIGDQVADTGTAPPRNRRIREFADPARSDHRTRGRRFGQDGGTQGCVR